MKNEKKKKNTSNWKQTKLESKTGSVAYILWRRGCPIQDQWWSLHWRSTERMNGCVSDVNAPIVRKYCAILYCWMSILSSEYQIFIVKNNNLRQMQLYYKLYTNTYYSAISPSMHQLCRSTWGYLGSFVRFLPVMVAVHHRTFFVTKL